MTVVNFHILPSEAETQTRLALACQLAVQESGKTCLLLADAAMTAAADEALWAQEGFHPHYVLQEADSLPAGASEAAIFLCTAPEYPPACDVLINLSLSTMDIPRGCVKIHEIVQPSDPAVLQSTRRRYAAYKQIELQPQTQQY